MQPQNKGIKNISIGGKRVISENSNLGGMPRFHGTNGEGIEIVFTQK